MNGKEAPNYFIVKDDLTPWVRSVAAKYPYAVGQWLLTVWHNWATAPDNIRLGTPAKAAAYDVRPQAMMAVIVGGKTAKKSQGYVAFQSLSANALKALNNGASLVMLSKPHDDLRTAVLHMLDFLAQYVDKHPNKDLSRISVHQCSQMTLAWDKELHRIKEVAALQEGSALLFETDFLKAWVVSTPAAIKREGERLGNCLRSSPNGYARRCTTIITLRDPRGDAVAAIEVQTKVSVRGGKVTMLYYVHQFHGPRNSDIPHGSRERNFFQHMVEQLGWIEDKDGWYDTEDEVEEEDDEEDREDDCEDDGWVEVECEDDE